MRCVEQVPAGARMVSFRQCQRDAGYGPDMKYCLQHSKQHKKTAPTIPIWQVAAYTRMWDVDDIIPVKIMVREATAASFIDEHGRRYAMKSQYQNSFHTEEEAKQYAIEGINNKLKKAYSTIAVCQQALKRIKK